MSKSPQPRFEKLAKRYGLEVRTLDVEADAFYLSHANLSWFFPFHEVDGKMLLGGEICYVDEANATLDKLDPADVLTLEEARASWHD